MDISNLPTLLTVEETANLLRLKRSTAYEYVQKGMIPSFRLGRSIRIPSGRILELLALGPKEKADTAAKSVNVFPASAKGRGTR
jgi:excisionase family DNA binding protein